MFNLKSIIFVGSLAAASFASADIIITPGPGNFPGDENILFNDAGLTNDGPLVRGISNQTQFLFNFFDAGEDLHVNGGQARIESLNDAGYQALSLEFDQDDVAFLTYIMNINVLNAAGDGTVHMYATPFGGSEVDLGVFDVSATGENWFRFSTTNGDFIHQIRFTTDVDVQDLRQNRVGGVQVVPEPASLAAMAMGLGLVGRRIRRRNK